NAELVLVDVAHQRLSRTGIELDEVVEGEHQRLDAFGDSRFSSSSEVRKRVSVWRSKLLKISAITSWASRRRVCDRLDINSVRSVCSTRSITSFCTASILSIRLTTSSAISSGRIASTRAACSGLSFDSTTAMVCGYSF